MKKYDSQTMRTNEWLSLAEAARRLNVHAATLRRWADAGDLPHMVTPGGHRRFNVVDLDQFAVSRTVQPSTRALTTPEVWAQRALTHAREDMPTQTNAHWLATMDDSIRERHRIVGRKLMALTLQFLSADDGAHLLDEAHQVGREYGEVSRSSGVSLSDALQAALFFRDKLLEASLDLPDTARPRHSDQSKLLKRINALLNTVQLGVAEIYEQAEAPATPTKPKRARR